MSVGHLTHFTEHNSQDNVRCHDLKVDGTLDLDVPLSIADIQPGLPSQVLITNLFGNVAWAPVPPVLIIPGPPNAIYQTDPTGTTSQWNTDLIVPGISTLIGALTCMSTIAAAAATITNNIIALNGNIIANMGDINALIGDINALVGTITGMVVTGDTLNSTLDTNVGQDLSVMNNATVNNDLKIGGDLNALGEIQILGNPGLNNQLIVNVAGLPTWGTASVASITPGPDRTYLKTVGVIPTWSIINTIVNLSATAFLPDSINLNLAAITTGMVFPALNVTISSNAFVGNLPVTPITYNPATGEFTLPYSGAYRFTVNANFQCVLGSTASAAIAYSARIALVDVGLAYSSITVATGPLVTSRYSANVDVIIHNIIAGQLLTFTYGRAGTNAVQSCLSLGIKCGIEFLDRAV